MSKMKINKIKENKITQAQVKDLISYSPLTGLFKWVGCKKHNRNGFPAGSIKVSKSGNRYLMLYLNGFRYRAHRIAFLYMTGSFPCDEVDHINGDGMDNRWRNLREVTTTENSRNQKLRCTNKSGVSGVCWDKHKRKWAAAIHDNCKRIHLGFFDKKDSAIRVRYAAEKILGYHKNHGRMAAWL